MSDSSLLKFHFIYFHINMPGSRPMQSHLRLHVAVFFISYNLMAVACRLETLRVVCAIWND